MLLKVLIMLLFFQIRAWLLGFAWATLGTSEEDMDFFSYTTENFRGTLLPRQNIGVAINQGKPVKVVMSEQVFILELRVPVEAQEALVEAKRLLAITNNKTIDYTWGEIPKLRIKAIESSILHLNATHKSIRSKRGWFDILGEFLKISTGVATEKDLKLIKEMFVDSNEKINLNIDKIFVHNKILTEAIQKLTNASIIHKNLLLETTNRDFLWHRISDAVSLASELVQLSETFTLQYKYLIDKLQAGVIPESIKEKSVFAEIVNKKNSSLSQESWGIDFMSIKQTKNLNKFVIKVPILSNETYQFYEICPCPLKTKNKAFVIADNYERFVGVSNNSYFVTNSKPSCRDLDDKKFSLCTTNLKFYDLNVGSCSLNIVKNLRNTNCHLKRYRGSELFFVDKSKETYIIKFFNYTKIAVTCSGKISFKNLKGVAIINPPCSLKSKLLSVATNNKIYEKTEISLQNWGTSHFFDSNLQLNEIEFTNEEIEKIKTLNETLEETLKMNFTEIQNEKIRYKIILKNHFIINYTIIVIIVLVGVTITTCWTIKRYRKKRLTPKIPNKNELCCVHPTPNYKELQKMIES